MSEHSSPSGAPIWYIVRANEEVAGGEEIVAGRSPTRPLRIG